MRRKLERIYPPQGRAGDSPFEYYRLAKLTCIQADNDHSSRVSVPDSKSGIPVNSTPNMESRTHRTTAVATYTGAW